jgi:oligopeptidase B
VIYARRHGLPRVLVFYPSSKELVMVPLPHWLGTVTPGVNRNYDAVSAKFIFGGYGMRETVLAFHFDTRQVEIVKSVDAAWSWDSICARRLHWPVGTGSKQVEVPVTLYHDAAFGLGDKLNAFTAQSVSQSTSSPDRPPPILIHTYASYGIPTDPILHPHYIPLLKRGWVIAMVHARGGGELGRRWAVEGQHGQSIRDVEQVARGLLWATQSTTSTNWLDTSIQLDRRASALGWSAGGLVLGSTMMRNPELFQSGVLHVPFVDPLSAMLNPDSPLTTTEYEMWGNPLSSRHEFESLLSISPYDTIPTALDNGPAMWLTAGMHDQRVQVWQVAKFAARLRDTLPRIY